MFTAQNVLKKLMEQNRCDGIDRFIETVIYESLFEYENFFQPIRIDADVVTKNEWKRHIFMQEMKLRGFNVKFNSDQREGDYYSISIPQQGN